MLRSFQENIIKRLVAVTSASPKAVVIVTILFRRWQIVLVGGVCDLTMVAK